MLSSQPIFSVRNSSIQSDWISAQRRVHSPVGKFSHMTCLVTVLPVVQIVHGLLRNTLISAKACIVSVFRHHWESTVCGITSLL